MFKRFLNVLMVCFILVLCIGPTVMMTYFVYAGEAVEPVVVEENIPRVEVEATVVETYTHEQIANLKEKIAKAPKLTQDEIELIALATMAEAEGEPELGKRWVIDTILNRYENGNYGKTIHDVVYAKNQYTAMHGERVTRCYVREDIVQLVKEEIVSRTNDEVLYFRTGHYHNFGTPMTQIGNHYFSTR